MSPDWFKKTSVYQVNPRTFSREGTIKAVTDELPTLKELGFGIIYLCPIFKTDDSKDKAYWSPRQIASNTENPKNPYRMVNYFEIDEEYGSMADLNEEVLRQHINPNIPGYFEPTDEWNNEFSNDRIWS